MTAFSALLAASPWQELSWRYVLTDLPEANLAFWRRQPALQTWLASGRLDVARFDAETDETLTLERSGEILRPGSLSNPLVVVANYVFDSLPQDAFAVRDGRLRHHLVHLQIEESEDEEPADWDDPAILDRVATEYREEAAVLPVYGEPALDAILEGYLSWPGELTLLFPVAALRCLGRLSAWADGRMLLLTGDKGESRPEELEQGQSPAIVRHGSFSMQVNYHAVGQWFAARGGVALATPHKQVSLAASAFVLGAGPARETRLAYALAVERGGPDDSFTLRKALQPLYASLEPDAVLALVRLVQWDPRVLADAAPALWPRLPLLSPQQRKEVAGAAARAWANYYFIGEARDLAFEYGCLFYALGEWEQAARRFEESLASHGAHAATWWNLGLSLLGAGKEQEAAGAFVEAGRADPAFHPHGALMGKQP